MPRALSVPLAAPVAAGRAVARRPIASELLTLLTLAPRPAGRVGDQGSYFLVFADPCFRPLSLCSPAGGSEGQHAVGRPRMPGRRPNLRMEDPILGVQKKTKPGEALAELAAKINAGHEECLTALQTSLGTFLEHARDTGALLQEAKDKVNQAGERWLIWVKDHCDFSVAQAQRYMRIANRYDELRKSEEDPTRPSLREALGLLSANSGTKAKQRRRALPQLFKVSSRTVVAELTRKARKVRLPDDSPEKRFVGTKASEIARQVLALVRKSQLKDKGDEPINPAQLAVALLEKLKASLNATLVVEVKEPGPASWRARRS